jgi:hypothetical protein
MRPTVLITQEPEDVEEMEQLETHHQKKKKKISQERFQSN